MARASDYLEAALLDHAYGITPFSSPATIYAAAHTSATNDAGGGTEVAGGSYARRVITNDNTEWARSGKVVSNLNIIDWVTASANWGTITHISLWDALTSGNMLIHGPLDTSVLIETGDTFRILAGLLDVTFNFQSNYLAGKCLDLLFGLDAFTAPSDLYLGLMTADPTEAGGGTEVTTVSTAYAREQIPNDNTSWSRSANVVENLNDVEFAVATATYGTIRSRALFDDPTAGNFFGWAPLAANRTINPPGQVRFKAGQLRQTLD